jgi:hypothetical protein
VASPYKHPHFLQVLDGLTVPGRWEGNEEVKNTYGDDVVTRAIGQEFIRRLGQIIQRERKKRATAWMRIV